MNNANIALPEIIRCKDCKHRGTYGCPMWFKEHDCVDGSWIEYEYDQTTDDGFCEKGERLDGQEIIAKRR